MKRLRLIVEEFYNVKRFTLADVVCTIAVVGIILSFVFAAR